MEIKDKLRLNFKKKLFEDKLAFEKQQQQHKLFFEQHLLENVFEFDSYAIEIIGKTLSPHDEFVARVLGLEGCEKSVTGKTKEEAIVNMQRAIVKSKNQFESPLFVDQSQGRD